jgi:hypothetical protein
MTTHFHALVISERWARARVPAHRVTLRQGVQSQLQTRRGFDARAVRIAAVRSDAYRETLISYIDRNPADAAIVPHGGIYPFGSAYHYVNSRGPIWLSRGWVEDFVRGSSPSGEFVPEAYVRKFSRGVSPGRLRWIEEQIRTGALDSPIVDRFLKNVPGRVLRYLRARARLAGRPGVSARGPV